jgi:hypothetical protein
VWGGGRRRRRGALEADGGGRRGEALEDADTSSLLQPAMGGASSPTVSAAMETKSAGLSAQRSPSAGGVCGGGAHGHGRDADRRHRHDAWMRLRGDWVNEDGQMDKAMVRWR